MDEGRRQQLAVFRRMTPTQRLRQASRLTACALAAREQRLRRQHPDASESELRDLRTAELLRFSPTRTLPA